jgi:tetratricopeptide (TPR) repeat protein
VRDYRKKAAFKAGAYTAIATAADQLKYLQGVKTINLADSSNLTVSTDSVKMLAVKYKAHYVLTLDNFNTGVYVDNSVYEGNQVVYYTTKVKTNFTLYESNGIFFKKLSGMAEVPQNNGGYSGGFSSLFFHPTANGSIPAINSAAREATLDALKDYLPFSISNDRPLYADAGALETSVELIKQGKFDVAFKILNPLIDGIDIKLASKAAYNLAVVYEAQGDIEEALKTAKLSNDKQRNDYANALIVALMKE